MTNFNEHALEMSIMELFKDEGYIHLNGSQIHREVKVLINGVRSYGIEHCVNKSAEYILSDASEKEAFTREVHKGFL